MITLYFITALAFSLMFVMTTISKAILTVRELVPETEKYLGSLLTRATIYSLWIVMVTVIFPVFIYIYLTRKKNVEYAVLKGLVDTYSK